MKVVAFVQFTVLKISHGSWAKEYLTMQICSYVTKDEKREHKEKIRKNETNDLWYSVCSGPCFLAFLSRVSFIEKYS